MAEKIDMSLDEIIKRDKISVGRGRRRGGKFSAGVSKFRTRKTNVRKIGATSRQMKSGVSVKRGKAVSVCLIIFEEYSDIFLLKGKKITGQMGP